MQDSEPCIWYGSCCLGPDLWIGLLSWMIRLASQHGTAVSSWKKKADDPVSVLGGLTVSQSAAWAWLTPLCPTTWLQKTRWMLLLHRQQVFSISPVIVVCFNFPTLDTGKVSVLAWLCITVNLKWPRIQADKLVSRHWLGQNWAFFPHGNQLEWWQCQTDEGNGVRWVNN